MEETDRHNSPVAFVFAPSPLLTVTIEAAPTGQAEVHLHAGGQGCWIARMLVILGVRTRLCGPFGAETGEVASALIRSEGVEVRATATTRANGAYVHDRRDGRRVAVAEMPPTPLSRHELDELYSGALAEAMAADVTVLAGPATSELMPSDTYRRLATDLRSLGKPVVADLSGDPLTAALSGGLTVLKVSHEELVEDGRSQSGDVEDLLAAVSDLAQGQVSTIVVSRAHDPALALVDGQLVEVAVPNFELVDPHGAGDSMTAGIAAGIAQGSPAVDAIRLGAAAGAMNVTRRGLGTGHRDVVDRLVGKVSVRPLPERGRQ